MKKILIRITVMVVLILVGYFFYQYLQDDYIPEYKREFHAKSPKKSQDYIKRKQYHEVVEEAYLEETESERRDENGNLSNQKIALRLHEVIQLLKDKNLSCERFVDGMMPTSELIDSDSPTYNNFESFSKKFDSILENAFRREIIFDSITEIITILEEVDKLERDMFYQTLRSLMICRNGDLSVLLESMHDAKIADEDKEKINRKIVEAIWLTIKEGDILPDNLLFAIKIMRQLGDAKKLGDSFQGELDEVHERISSYDEFYFDEIHSSEIVNNPAFRFRAYIDEMKEVSDEVLFVMRKAFPEYTTD